MSALRLTGSTSGYSEITPPAIAGDQTFTLPGTGGTLDRLNRAGNILQVVNGTTSTGVSATSSTYVDTTLAATITPTSASSKILITVHQNGVGKTNDNYAGLRLLRASTQIALMDLTAGFTGTATANRIGSVSIEYLDSPNTTSAVTYKTQLNSDTSNSSVQINSAVSTITLMEVAA